MRDEFFVKLDCPRCDNTSVYADRKVKIRVSAVCSRCHKVFIGHLWDETTYKPEDEPSWIRRRPFSVTCQCPCPGCLGKIMADGHEDVRLSVKCAKKHRDGYSRYYIADLRTEETIWGRPIRKYGRNRQR